MTERSDVLLADLLATQKRVLEIEEELLRNSRMVIDRQRRALVWFAPFMLLILMSPYIPWLISRLVPR